VEVITAPAGDRVELLGADGAGDYSGVVPVIAGATVTVNPTLTKS
jgi:hypothetical protein